MSKLYITCWRYGAHDDGNKTVACPKAPPVAEMVLDIGTQSISSDHFPPYTKFISIKATADCAIAFGRDSEDEKLEADPNFHIVEAGERLWYGVDEGMQIAVVGVFGL